jgi:hypothetical protein
MLALELTDIKDFMNKFLRSEIFDHFLLQEGVVTSAASFVIDGRITRGFYSGEELEELGIRGYSFLPYAMLRTNCFDLIKGKKTPASFKFVLLLSPENLRRTLESIGSSFSADDVTGVFLNIRYQNQMLTLTTGVSYRIFSTDRTLDGEWDRLVKVFLRQHDIAFTEL